MHNSKSLSSVKCLKHTAYMCSGASNAIVSHYFSCSKAGGSKITENKISNKSPSFILITVH